MSEERKIFDPKFVYLEWDDVLEGKQVFIADTLPELRRFVERAYPRWSVKKHDGDYPFVTEDSVVRHTMAYYDPNYECKVAYAHGKTIQFRSQYGDKEWVDCGGPAWSETYEYRVKPEKKWRPFKDIAELKQTWSIKRSPLVHPELEESEIWVRDKKRPDITRLITGFNGGCNCVAIAGQWHILEGLFDDYEFLDGTPCGVEE